MVEKRRSRGERLWMAAVWLFFVAWFLGANLWKGPQYARLYDQLEMKHLPPATSALLSISSIVSRFWFVVVPLLLAPLLPIALGTFDGKGGKFTVLLLIASTVMIAVYAHFLFYPRRHLEERLKSLQPAPTYQP